MQASPLWLLTLTTMTTMLYRLITVSSVMEICATLTSTIPLSESSTPFKDLYWLWETLEWVDPTRLLWKPFSHKLT